MAMYFDTNSWIEMSGFSNPETFTLSFWIYLDNHNSQFRPIGSDDNWEVRFPTDGGLDPDFFDSNFSVGTYISASVWYHIAFTCVDNNGDIKIYVDGDYKETVDADLNSPTNTTLSLGARQGNGELEGYLDDVRIYDRVLSAEEIATIYACRGSDGIVDGFMHRWMLNEGHDGEVASGAGTVKDSAGSLNGTPAGTGDATYTATRLKLGRGSNV